MLRAVARGQVGEVDRRRGLPHPAFDVVRWRGPCRAKRRLVAGGGPRGSEGSSHRCPRCGTDNAPGAKFCTECGSALSTSCPECGHSPRRVRTSARSAARRCRRDRLRAPWRAAQRARRCARRRRGAATRTRPSCAPCRCCSSIWSATPHCRSCSIPTTCATCSALLRRGTPHRRALRRHDREVHRRRGDGRVGNAGGPRGRRRAGRARRARARRCGGAPCATTSAPRACGARRRGHRPGRAADQSGGGRGGGRPRQHRGARAGRRRPGDRAGRRHHPPGHLDRDRLRGRRSPRAQGQDRAGSSVARGRGAGGAARGVRADASPRALRRPRRRTCD